MTEPYTLVSIITPFYNSERFLAETVESVLAQTYPHWELLLVDDGSTDASSAIAREYAARRPGQIHYVAQLGGNRGMDAARNLGERHAQGQILAFLDSDDVWLPDKLSERLAIFDQHPEVGFAYGHSEYWVDWDAERKTDTPNSIPLLSPADRVYLPPELLVGSYPLGPWGAPCPSSFVVRRSAFQLVGGFEEAFHPGTFQLYEDEAFFAKLALTVPIYVSSTCCERYRCGEDTGWIRALNTSTDEAARRFYYRWLRGYLKREKIVDMRVWAALRRSEWSYRLPFPAAFSNFVRRAVRRLRSRNAPKY